MLWEMQLSRLFLPVLSGLLSVIPCDEMIVMCGRRGLGLLHYQRVPGADVRGRHDAGDCRHRVQHRRCSSQVTFSSFRMDAGQLITLLSILCKCCACIR